MLAFDDTEDRQRARFTRRLALLGLGKLAAFGAIGARLYQLQVVEGDRYAALAEDNRINVQALAPQRGRILDAAGHVLADNAEAFRIVIVPSLAGGTAQVVAVLERVAQVVPLSEAERARILARVRRQAPNQPQVVASDLTFEQIAAINVLAPSLPGIETEIAGRRRYADGRVMGHIVGYVGAHERPALDDDPVLRVPGMKFGKTGVEAALDQRLRGSVGQVRHEVDARGRIVRTLQRTAPTAGADVTLSIDRDLQAGVLERMEQSSHGAVVALDCATGEVAAMASVPTFDPSELVDSGGRAIHISNVEGEPPAVSRRGFSRLVSTAGTPMVNRAIRGLYPPGSTFKLVTALAALKAGAVTLRDRLPCEGQFELAGQVFRCWKRSGHGSCDLHRALRESCDCYFYECARRIGIEAISTMGRTLGLGQIYAEAGISQQKAGLIPTPGWKRARHGTAWLAGETVLAAIGQGYVLATPLQLATMTARIATGRAVTPTVLRRAGGVGAPPLDIDQRHLEAVRRGMAAVVNEDGGTGQNARIDERDIRVAGKTGTSQVTRRSAERDGDLSWEERDHALFVGYFPVERPRFALAAVVEHGGGGGATAAPLVRDVIEILLDWQAETGRSRKSLETMTRG